MKFPKVMRLSAISLALILVLLSGCTAKKNSSAAVNFAGTDWEVTKYDKAEIIDGKGEYVIDKLNNVKVSELKTVGDKQVIYHLGQPYLFHALHVRYDHLIDFGKSGLNADSAKAVFEQGVKLAKEAGYNTVILYLSWDRFYNGIKYDFSEIEYQYSIAKKYDLNIMWNWFGYDVCGFGGYREWQYTDQEKYPPLKDENGEVIMSDSYYEGGTHSGKRKPIPDLSVQSFIDIEVEALNQLTAWLNVNDTDRRTIGIQIENEPNHSEGGHGLWFSQYEALTNLLNELGKAIKNGPYSMLTYLNLMSAGWDQVDENGEKTVFKTQIKGLIEKEYIDIVGYDFYDSTLSDDALKMPTEQGDNPHLMVEFGPCVWCVPAQTNILLSNGYGIGYYHALQWKLDKNSVDSGLFSYVDRNNYLIMRDGSNILGGYHSGDLDVIASEFIMMNHSINALSQVIAIAPNDNMIYFNKNMLTKNFETKELLGKTFTFETNCGGDRYGSTGLLIKADDSTYYAYGSKSATITLVGGIKSASEGIYRDGEWVKSKDVSIVDGKLTLEAGKAYRFII